jgi:hypothetical protein
VPRKRVLELREEWRDGKGVQIRRVKIVTEPGESDLRRLYCSTGLRLSFQHGDLPSGLGEEDSGDKAVMPRTDDDDVVTQGVIRPPFTCSTWPVM